MPKELGVDVLEVVLSAKSISPLVIAGHSISHGGVILGSSGSNGDRGKKVEQKSSALLWLSFAIMSPVLRAGVGVRRMPHPIFAINQMLSGDACSKKLLDQTRLACRIAILRAASSLRVACLERSLAQSLAERSRHCLFHHGFRSNLKTCFLGGL